MSSRAFKLKPNDSVTPCPRCGNNVAFTCHSQQVAEDCCEVWVVCECGFDPFEGRSGHKLEDAMGGCDGDNCINALGCWNTSVLDWGKGVTNGTIQEGEL